MVMMMMVVVVMVMMTTNRIMILVDVFTYLAIGPRHEGLVLLIAARHGWRMGVVVVVVV